jgi:hypothetical protein
MINRAQQILGFVNEARRTGSWGGGRPLKPLTRIKQLRGRARDPVDCPLARAMPAGVEVHEGHLRTYDEKQAKKIAAAWGHKVYQAKGSHAFRVDLPDVLEIFVLGVDAVRCDP